MTSLPAGLILGHRGAPAREPENTLRSFRAALALGADGVELDVQPTADGVLVVLHDATLERTTSGTGPVASCTWQELARLDAGRGEPVPRLVEVLDWARVSDAWLNVELKAQAAEVAAVRLVRAAGWLGRTIFSSFAPELLAEVARVEPRAHRFLLAERWDPAGRAQCANCAAQGVCLEDAAATPAALAELAAVRLPVVVWTVDDAARIRGLLSAGATAVITNYPDRAVRARQSRPGR